MRAIVILLICAGTGVAKPKPGDEGTLEYQKAAELVKQLGAAQFAARESAAKSLIDMGAAAVPALTAGTKSTDAEVRNRSAALIPKAVAVEWDRRANAFLADRDGKRNLEFPLVGEFEKVVGPLDAGSRKLFAEMLRSHGPLLELTANDRKTATEVMKARFKECLDTVRAGGKQVKAPLGELAALANRAKRQPSEFGLTSYLSSTFWFGGQADGITLRVYGFETEEARKKGLAKWDAEMKKK